MHIRGLLTAGTALAGIAALLTPWRLFPLAVPSIVGLLWLRYECVYWAHDERDARRSATILDVTVGVLFILGVTGWTVGPTLMMFGFLLNRIVVMANGGAMPIIGASEPPPSYVPVGSGTRLRWLADVFMTEKGRPRPKLFSAGDAVIVVGLWVYAVELLLARYLQ